MKTVFLLLSMIASPVFAIGPDMSSLTNAIDFGGSVDAILVVAAVMATVYVVKKSIVVIFAAVGR